MKLADETAAAPSSASCALGPHRVCTLDAQHLCAPTFPSATIYYPESGTRLPSIVIVGGWGCGEQVQAAWAPFYASHGIVAMTIGTPAPLTDMCEERARALLDASAALQDENAREGSALVGRLDASSRAVQGYSLGGGGAQLAALRDPTLKCVVAICPDDGGVFGGGNLQRSSRRLCPPSSSAARKTRTRRLSRTRGTGR